MVSCNGSLFRDGGTNMGLNKNDENHGKDDYEACEKGTENVLEKSNRNHLERRHFLPIPLLDFD